MYLCMYVCMCVCMYVNMCVFLYVSVYVFAIYLFSIGTVNNSPLQLRAFSLVQFASLCCMSSKSIDSIKALNNFRYLVMSSCLLSGQFLCLFGVLGALVAYCTLCSETGDDPWFGRPGRMNTSRHSVGEAVKICPRFPVSQQHSCKLCG